MNRDWSRRKPLSSGSLHTPFQQEDCRALQTQPIKGETAKKIDATRRNILRAFVGSALVIEDIRHKELLVILSEPA